jgi:hypothetical protein
LLSASLFLRLSFVWIRAKPNVNTRRLSGSFTFLSCFLFISGPGFYFRIFHRILPTPPVSFVVVRVYRFGDPWFGNSFGWFATFSENSTKLLFGIVVWNCFLYIILSSYYAYACTNTHTYTVYLISNVLLNIFVLYASLCLSKI